MTNQDFVPTVTTEQLKLHEAMRRASDPRWDLMKVDPMPSPPTRKKYLGWTVGGAVFVIVVIAIMRSAAGRLL